MRTQEPRLELSSPGRWLRTSCMFAISTWALCTRGRDWGCRLNSNHWSIKMSFLQLREMCSGNIWNWFRIYGAKPFLTSVLFMTEMLTFWDERVFWWLGFIDVSASRDLVSCVLIDNLLWNSWFRRNLGLAFPVSCEVVCRPSPVAAWFYMACELGMASTFLNGWKQIKRYYFMSY